MYNAHRGMVPAPNSRLTELLDQLRQEFESQSRNTGEFEHQCMCPISPFLHTATPSYIMASCAEEVSPLSNHFMNTSYQLHGFRHSLKCYLTDRSCSDRTAPGNGDDPSEGLSAGTSSDQDQDRVRFASLNPCIFNL
jgi:hypothetical protein